MSELAADYFEHYRPEDLLPEKIAIEKIVIESGLGQGDIPTYHFLHMFSGLRREKDLEWYLVRIGAKHGMRVVVVSLDSAYGSEYDLADASVVRSLKRKGQAGFWSGVHNGSPCSTWSKVRFQPGGPLL